MYFDPGASPLGSGEWKSLVMGIGVGKRPEEHMLMWVLLGPYGCPAEVHNSAALKEGPKLVAMSSAGLFPTVATFGLPQHLQESERGMCLEFDSGGRQWQLPGAESLAVLTGPSWWQHQSVNPNRVEEGGPKDQLYTWNCDRPYP